MATSGETTSSSAIAAAAEGGLSADLAEVWRPGRAVAGGGGGGELQPPGSEPRQLGPGVGRDRAALVAAARDRGERCAGRVTTMASGKRTSSGRTPLTSVAATRREAKAAAREAQKRNAPCLRLDAHREMSIHLAAWAGFRHTRSTKLSNGGVVVTFGGDVVDPGPVRPEHEAAYRWILDHSLATQRHVLSAIGDAYPKPAAPGGDEHGDDDDLVAFERSIGFDDYDQRDLPSKVDYLSLRDLVQLTRIHIHQAQRDNVAYVGYELACAWEFEHGLGVLTHLDRVVEVGHADTSFTWWIADRDRRRKRRR